MYRPPSARGETICFKLRDDELHKAGIKKNPKCKINLEMLNYRYKVSTLFFMYPLLQLQQKQRRKRRKVQRNRNLLNQVIQVQMDKLLQVQKLRI